MVLKTIDLARGPWVRIPVSPPFFHPVEPSPYFPAEFASMLPAGLFEGTMEIPAVKKPGTQEVRSMRSTRILWILAAALLFCEAPALPAVDCNGNGTVDREDIA